MIASLLLQAVPSSLEGEVATHPYVVVAAIGALFASFVGVLKILLVFFERRINEKFAAVEGHNVRQDERLDAIESDLRRYDTHVAVGVQESGAIHSAVQRVEATLTAHVEKEEGVTWAKIDALVGAINDMRLANEVAHAGLVTGQTVLATRVDAVEKKMPNGELQKLAEAYHALAQRDLAARASRTKKR
jgi:hypothetical protein